QLLVNRFGGTLIRGWCTESATAQLPDRDSSRSGVFALARTFQFSIGCNMGRVTLTDEGLLAIEVVVDIAVLGLARGSELALRQKLHPRYLERLLQTLARKGIIMGARGRQGGYQLARDAALIRASDVALAATGEPIRARKAQG